MSPDLLAPSIGDQVRVLASPLSLPTFVGFECRLKDDDARVDMQLGYASSDSPRLAATCEAMLARSRDHREAEIWTAIAAFASVWQSSSSPAGRAVSNVWLEFDVPPSGALSWRPSFFAVLSPDHDFKIEDDLLPELTHAQTPPSLRRSLARCREACPAHSSISHVGVLLGRELHGCRIHASRLPSGGIGTYLEDIGWPGDIGEAASLATAMRGRTDNVVLCLDVADRVLPQLGMECFFDAPDDLKLPWGAVFDELISRGLCSPRKRDALLAWTGVTHPSPRLTAWPDSLILESLLQPPDRFGAFRRRLNHVKISIVPDGAPLAKAYFGYAHEWLEAQCFRA